MQMEEEEEEEEEKNDDDDDDDARGAGITQGQREDKEGKWVWERGNGKRGEKLGK
ncbi:hypothetical protein HO173_011210 [Letharia columbiana]|uniref:Uncharacterized protein n=1 Tax=Letharia columbiana TaxID=112416 RepID=A0A8H6FJM5_9LECA|nr:uncharacterized protein HO173_011210 [Letharia columbiana]KAF6229780.1 hypothetical protein HO173_011210 [Letharia columbiana]